MLIEIKEGLAPQQSCTENCLYYDPSSGQLSVCMINNWPINYIIPGLHKRELKQTGDLPQDFILKLIAIGNKPERVHDFV